MRDPIDHQGSMRANMFFFAACLTLGFNLVSQQLAFPIQVVLIIYGVFKYDLRMLPSLFLLALDKAHIAAFNAMFLKFHLGVAVSVINILLLVFFAASLWGFFRNKYDSKSCILMLIWLLGLIPVLYFVHTGRRDHVSFWQEPIQTWLSLGLYFWGIASASTWQASKDFVVTRFLAIYIGVNLLILPGGLKLFTFVAQVIPLCFGIYMLQQKYKYHWKVVALISVVSAVLAVLFSKYLAEEEKSGFADNSEMGSSFTSVAVFCTGLLLCLYSKYRNAIMVRKIPIFALSFCVCVFFYAVVRINQNNVDITHNYQTIVERFEFKLIGDRGMIWNERLKEVLNPPYIFKEMKDFTDVQLDLKTGEPYITMRLMPHNEILCRLWYGGWWWGLSQIVILWIMMLRATKVVANGWCTDAEFQCLYAPYVAIFFCVGLTGQTVWNSALTGNAMVTMVFPGVLWGLFLNAHKAQRVWRAL